MLPGNADCEVFFDAVENQRGTSRLPPGAIIHRTAEHFDRERERAAALRGNRKVLMRQFFGRTNASDFVGFSFILEPLGSLELELKRVATRVVVDQQRHYQD